MARCDKQDEVKAGIPFGCVKVKIKAKDFGHTRR